MTVTARPVVVTEQPAAATPSPNTVVIYAKADGFVYAKDDAGVETMLSNSAGGAQRTFAFFVA